MLADDSVTAQNMGRKILADAGYEVITVNNGSAALKKIAEQKPDLIVLDVYMPGYSGLEVCQRLKEAQETARVPVLLTVGKLEPFKPEEAKRVRADGFIVKPFEASELLGALSKLEDKIVPRAEASKPGRFARVTAAIEEGRYDKTVAIEEDVGWKNRISFPSKKKEKSAPEDSDSASIYKPLEKPRSAQAEEAKVDLGALAPEGLPKDVTPEEIAALAAAAAQMKGKIAETENIQPAAPIAEQKSEGSFAEATFEKKSTENEKIEEKSDASREKSTEAAAEADIAATASHSDLMAAIVGLDPGAAGLPALSSGDVLSSPDAPQQPANEPVTMALAAKVDSVAGAPRWTAVSVALGKEEAAISLEHEMQKAYAAFAAAVDGHMSSASAIPETVSDSTGVVATTNSSSAPQAALPEPVAIPALAAPEAVQTLSSALGNASTDAIRAAVQELEMVAESFVGETAPAGSGSAPVAEGAASQLPTAVPQAAEGTTKDTWGRKVDEPHQDAGKRDSEKREEPDSPRQEPANHDWNKQSWKSEEQTNTEQKNAEQKNDQWKNEEPFVAAAGPAPESKHEASPDKLENTTPAFATPTEQTSAIQLSSNVETSAVAQGRGEAAKKESDAAETTAAAWASWRRIRESGDSKAASDEPAQREAEQTSTLQDSAAMAVAAGAEKTPEPTDAESDPAAIASIVDSVLADLRPKIFEEISRKMGKKK